MKDRTPPSLLGRAITLSEKSCAICGDLFRAPKHLARRYSTCSDDCSRKRKQTDEPVTRTCEVCGAAMSGAASMTPERYCSNACRLTGLNRLPRRRGEGVFAKHIDRKGYVRGAAWYGDKRRTVFEHRWVMEQRLGRRLRRGEVVHHSNGDRADNRIENLELFTTHTAHLHVEHTPSRYAVTEERRSKIASMIRSGMRQVEVAKALGISEATVSNMLKPLGLRARDAQRNPSTRFR